MTFSRKLQLTIVIVNIFWQGSLALTPDARIIRSSTLQKERMQFEDSALTMKEHSGMLENPISSLDVSGMPQVQQSCEGTDVKFSHIQLFVDELEPLEAYKQLEQSLNLLHEKTYDATLAEQRKIWESISGRSVGSFSPQGQDVVKQLLIGFGFRVTGYRYPSCGKKANTRSLLVTSPDPNGVKVVVTSQNSGSHQEKDNFEHFDAGYHKEFYVCHDGRQGIGVLGFHVNNVDSIYERYENRHPELIHSFREYTNDDGQATRILQVFAYYEEATETGKLADRGTLLRFMSTETLPGLLPLESKFDLAHSQPAYCDHWVSNVHSRTDFWKTLEDVLDFGPKVDFNAGVVAAGEAQIESTVLGNTSPFETTDKEQALVDQSQVYLPINNALSEVGHVHGFLKELGQGVQHCASRVDDLVRFVQRCNDMRQVTGEGFSFLAIPRSYYGVLTEDFLASGAGISLDLAAHLVAICQREGIVALDGAMDLATTREELIRLPWDDSLPVDHLEAFGSKKEEIIDRMLLSRYSNMFALLGDQISEEQYLGIVQNQILVDVQGTDILYQIFTCNILQRKQGDEAPFFEFIQRVCSPSKEKIKPGCGGFGIRNFLTLFLSIEVSKATSEVLDAMASGDKKRLAYAESKVECFTNQLNDSNPILTEISDSMTEEGECKEEFEAAVLRGDEDAAMKWSQRMKVASQRKEVGNAKLMECSARYATLMKSIRESAELTR